MPLQRRLVDVPMSAGLNQKADVRALEISGAVTLNNCVQLKTGAVRKRWGHVAISKTTEFSSGGGASTLAASVYGGSQRGSPWLSDGTLLYSYSDASSAWTTIGRVPEVVALDNFYALSTGAGTLNAIDYDITYCNGYLIVVCTFLNASGVQLLQWTAVDAVTRSVVVPQSLTHTSATNALTPRLTTCGTKVILTYAEGAHIQGRVLDCSTAANLISNGFGASTALDDNAPVSPALYSVSEIVSDATRFMIAYEINAGGKSVEIRTFSTALAGLVTTTNETQANFNTIVQIACCGTSAGQVFVSYTATGGASASVANPVTRAWSYADGGATNTPATLHTWTETKLGTASTYQAGSAMTIAVVDSTHAYVFWSPWPFSNTARELIDAYTFAQGITPSAGAIILYGPLRTTWNREIASRPFVVNGVGYITQYVPSIFQGGMQLGAADWWGLPGVTSTWPQRPVVQFSPRLSKTLGLSLVGTLTVWPLPRWVQVQAINATTYASLVPVDVGFQQVALAIEFVDFASQQRGSAGELGSLEMIAAGSPTLLAAGNAIESQFTHYPEFIATYSAAGGSLSIGAYLYQCVYEWTDNAGNIHRSATSPVVTVASSANTGSVTLSVANMGFTRRLSDPVPGFGMSSPPAIVVYRSLVNGTVMYRVTATPIPSGNLCTLTASGLQIVDTLADASISSNPLIYTTGGVLDNFNPPAARICITHRNRFWLAGCDDPTSIWPSKELTPGESPGFNEAQNFTATGRVRALASLDDKLVVFVQRGATYGLEFITGEGPTDLGTLSDWTPPQGVPSDVGAVDQRSVCWGPFGVLFRSPNGGPNGQGGIYLLGRDLTMQYVSRPVEDTLAANPVVTSMTVHPSNGRVYLTCAPTDAVASGVRLVWDYTNGGVWSTDTIADPDTSQSNAGARCAFVARTSQATTTGGMAYYWATVAGRVYRESQATYLDAGTWIPSTYQSAWIKPSLSGFARFWRVQLAADSLENSASLSMTLAYDFSSVYTETSSWTPTNVSGFTRFPVIEFQMVPGNQKAKAIQISLSDSQGTAPVSGQGMSWAGLAIEMGVKDRAYPNLIPGQKQ